MRWSEGMAMTDALNTVRSAKDFFFPQTEDLVTFKMEGKSIEIIDPRTETEDFRRLRRARLRRKKLFDPRPGLSG